MESQVYFMIPTFRNSESIKFFAQKCFDDAETDIRRSQRSRKLRLYEDDGGFADLSLPEPAQQPASEK